MTIYNVAKIAYRSLLRNKMRALLTMLGIIIGIASVIAMVSIGQSSTYNIKSEIAATGSNMIFIMPEAKTEAGARRSYADTKSLKLEDITALKKQSKYLNAISPYIASAGQFIYGNNNYPSSISGIDTDYFKICNLELESGTIFNTFDVASSAKVCIIGKTIVNKLFPNDPSPIGKTIRFNKIPLRVIGVMKEKGQEGMGQSQDDMVFVPYTTIQSRIMAIEHVQMIYASIANEKETQVAVTELEEILRRQHKIISSSSDDFTIRTQAEMLAMVNKVTSMLTALLAAIGSISLLVGGIGIMNIMYVTVTERTKEIGLRMAIGAQNRNILFQFLSESIILCFMGGIVGIVLGLCIAYGVTHFLQWPFILSMSSIFISFIVCGSVGIFFGWYPAKKASELDPITALRYE